MAEAFVNLSRKYGKDAKAFCGAFFWIFPIALTIRDKVGYPVFVDGSSMSPTLNPVGKWSNFVWMNSSYSARDCARGHIVILDRPRGRIGFRNSFVIKRIVALEKDFVTPKNGPNTGRCFRIPAGHCWIEGDNSKSSTDSRNYQSVPLGLIKGRATHIIWPPSQWSKLSHQPKSSTSDIRQSLFD
eukprot:GSMAST32.ASY1.ANO1.173.1 assembled CDS